MTSKEALRKICNHITKIDNEGFTETIGLEYADEYRQIQQDLEALELINKKNIDIPYFRKCKTVFEYNKYYYTHEKLFKSEFDLLKEVLKNE